MQTINRTGGNLTIGCYRGTDPVRGNYIRDWKYSHADQTCTMDCGESTGYLRLFHGEIDPFWKEYNGWNDNELEIGPLPKDHQIVIVDRDGKLGYVDWSNVYAKWNGQETTLAADSSKVADSIAVAQSLINALGTGIAATGPVGALPAGAVLGVGSLILQELGKNVPKPPPPPDLEAIGDAVETIVKDQLDAAEAVKAASRLF
jgi:hypothetical protein